MQQIQDQKEINQRQKVFSKRGFTSTVWSCNDNNFFTVNGHYLHSIELNNAKVITTRKDPWEFGLPSTIRTCDLRLRRAVLYPAELWAVFVLKLRL